MPYKLRKAPKRDAYWVVNKETGKKHSKDPLPKDRAEAQMRALYAAEDETKGGMYSPIAKTLLSRSGERDKGKREVKHLTAVREKTKKELAKAEREMEDVSDIPAIQQLAEKKDMLRGRIDDTKAATESKIRQANRSLKSAVFGKPVMGMPREGRPRKPLSPLARREVGEAVDAAKEVAKAAKKAVKEAKEAEGAVKGSGRRKMKGGMENDGRRTPPRGPPAQPPALPNRNQLPAGDDRLPAPNGDGVPDPRLFAPIDLNAPPAQAAAAPPLLAAAAAAAAAAGGPPALQIPPMPAFLPQLQHQNAMNFQQPVPLIAQQGPLPLPLALPLPQFFGNQANVPLPFRRTLEGEALEIPRFEGESEEDEEDERRRRAADTSRSSSRARRGRGKGIFHQLNRQLTLAGRRQKQAEAQRKQDVAATQVAFFNEPLPSSILERNVMPFLQGRSTEERVSQTIRERGERRTRFQQQREVERDFQEGLVGRDLMRQINDAGDDRLPPFGVPEPREFVGSGKPISLPIMTSFARGAYSGHTPKSIAGFTLVKGTPTIKFYEKGDTIIVAVRGTQDKEDVDAWIPSTRGKMDTTSRYAKDEKEMREFREKNPNKDYIAVGHSLAGATIDLFLRRGLVRSGVSFNPMVEPQERNGGTRHRRIYNKQDPLYLLYGRNTKGAEAYEFSDPLWKRWLKYKLPIPASVLFNVLDAHNIDTMRGRGYVDQAVMRKIPLNDPQWRQKLDDLMYDVRQMTHFYEFRDPATALGFRTMEQSIYDLEPVYQGYYPPPQPNPDTHAVAMEFTGDTMLQNNRVAFNKGFDQPNPRVRRNAEVTPLVQQYGAKGAKYADVVYLLQDNPQIKGDTMYLSLNK